MEGFRIEMEQELQTLRFELEDEGKAMLGIFAWIIILSYLFIYSSTLKFNIKSLHFIFNF